MPTPQFHGLIILDKPGGITSRAALDRAANWFPRGTKLGHAGTLDPLATGVLVLCVGAATRLVEFVQDMPKTYRTTLLLGAASDTDDADGIITKLPDRKAPDLQAVHTALAGFVGTQAQVPPAYSAAKVSGRRAHHLARQGNRVQLEPRLVHIHAIDLLAYAYPQLELEVRCGKGTYIRSLARDLGRRLDCGALVQSLRRTQVGPFLADGALTLEADRSTAQARLLPLAAAVSELPRITVTGQDAQLLRRGMPMLWTEQTGENTTIAAFDVLQNLVAIVRTDKQQKALRPEKVIVT